MDKATIGQALKTARERAGLSINKVATRVGTGYERIKALEEGRGNYGIDTLIAYAEVIGYTLIVVEANGIAIAPKEEKKKEEVKVKPVQTAGEEVVVKKKKKIVIEEA